MKLSDLKYDYPEELIALVPSRPTRVMWIDKKNKNKPQELTIDNLIEKIPAGDVLVINDTQVLRRRIFTADGLEILFLDQDQKNGQNQNWNVLFPSKKYKIGDVIELPQGFKMTLLEKGLPQKVSVTPDIFEKDFEKIGELPLPPYIQKARNIRHNVETDKTWYQTAWAENPGSYAAPTASLHFSEKNIDSLISKGVIVVKITLHVGLGTFLPVKVEDLDQHKMHSEIYNVDQKSWNIILDAHKNQRGIWAMGTTVTRTLETVIRNNILSGESDILLQVGSEFKIVNRLITNFHQPESTLLALVAGFSDLDTVKKSYAWAIENRFKLFSYGDLSIWLK